MCVLLLVVFDCLILNDRIGPYSAGYVKQCGGSFVCVYIKIISDGLFVDFVKIWLNLLPGLTVFGVKCCDLYIFWGCGMSEV